MKTLLILLILVILMVISITNAYTSPDFTGVNFTLGSAYTPQPFTGLNFTLGEGAVVVSDSCTYSSGDWAIDCSDDCSITSNVNLGGNNITITGTGTFQTTANITNFISLSIIGTDSSNRCIASCLNGGCFRSQNLITGLCFQESANVSTGCGGLSTGTYNFTGAWTDPENTIDGNYGSFGLTAGSGSENLSINYSKPTGAVSSSVWQNQLGVRAIQNTTIPSGCWSQDALMFRINSHTIGIQAVKHTDAFCYNGTEWDEIVADDASSDGNDPHVYEESMWWNISG